VFVSKRRDMATILSRSHRQTHFEGSARGDAYLEYEEEDDRHRETHDHKRDPEQVCIGILGG